MTAHRNVASRVRSEERGHTLIELLVTMSILGIVLGSLTTMLVSGSKAELDVNRRFESQQNSRLAFMALRKDLHVAACADASTAGRLVLYNPSNYDAPGGYSGTLPAVRSVCGTPTPIGTPVLWCTYLVAAAPVTRYDLYRVVAATCPATEVAAQAAGGKFWADYLTTNNLFSDPGSTTQQHQGITVTLPITTGLVAGRDSYTLTDTIVLRNSPRSVTIP